MLVKHLRYTFFFFFKNSGVYHLPSTLNLYIVVIYLHLNLKHKNKIHLEYKVCKQNIFGFSIRRGNFRQVPLPQFLYYNIDNISF